MPYSPMVDCSTCCLDHWHHHLASFLCHDFQQEHVEVAPTALDTTFLLLHLLCHVRALPLEHHQAYSSRLGTVPAVPTARCLFSHYQVLQFQTKYQEYMLLYQFFFRSTCIKKIKKTKIFEKKKNVSKGTFFKKRKKEINNNIE